MFIIYISQYMKSWIYYLIVCCAIAVVSVSSVSAVRESKEGFMYNYQSSFLAWFPEEVNNRSMLINWCHSILDTTITVWGKELPLDWFYYNGIYVAPRQSVFAYMMCKWVDSKIYKSFDKTLIAAISGKSYEQIIPDFDTVNCKFSDAKNNLSRCNMIQLATDLVSKITSDFSNIRLAWGWWYTSANEDDVWYLMAQYFSYAVGKDEQETNNILNTNLCSTAQISYFQTNRSQQCGFPITYNTILQNRKNRGLPLIKQSTLIDASKILLYSCDYPDSGTNLVWCGINDHLSTQNYNALIQNEVITYGYFLASYQWVASTNRYLIDKDMIWLSDSQYRSLLGQLSSYIETQKDLVVYSTNMSTNLIAQFEANYAIHIWFLAAIEIAQKMIPTWGQWKVNFANTLIDRQNTKVESTNAKWTTPW